MKRNDCLIVLCVICMLAAALSGCRSTASSVAQATDRAERLYDRACSLLNDAAYQVQDQYAPLSEKADLPENAKITLSERGQINPMVDDALAEAISGLEKALAEPDQPEYDQIRARAMLARLYALKGFRLGLQASEKRRQAYDAASGVELAAVRMSKLGKEIANYDQLLSISDPTLAELTADTKKAIDELAGEIKKTNDEAGALEKEKAGLSEDNNKLLAEARDLDTRSRSVDAVSGVDIFDQAQSLRDKVGKNSARIAQIEDGVTILQGRLADLQARKAAAEAKLAQFEKMASSRKTHTDELQAQRGKKVADLSDAQAQAQKDAAEAAALAGDARKVEAEAIDAYSKAVDAYAAYEAATDKYARDPQAAPFLKPDPAIVAMLGDARMARGEVRLRALILQRRFEEVVKETTAIWSALPVQNSAPAVIDQLDDYLADVTQVKDNAQDDFRWAAKIYDKAGKTVEDRKLRWAYVLHQAGANVSLYRLSGDPAAKQEATDNLNSLGSQESSPNILPAASDFRNRLENPPLFAQAK